MLSNAFRRILQKNNYNCHIHITAAPSSAPASSKSHVTEGKNTQNKKKGETHQKVELIFQKVSGGLVIEPPGALSGNYTLTNCNKVKHGKT